MTFANPQDGTVSAGQATITTTGATTTISQSSNRAVIDWRGFDIAPTETTRFDQPNSSSLTLNRVNSAGPSSINGTLSANGNVIIVNPNGVFFGPTSRVDVNGLIATTADIDNGKFMAGSMAFDKPGNPAASIENHGLITAKQAGLVGFVAPNVSNSGIISAKLGRVHLASGDTATVDLYGDGLLEVAVKDDTPAQLVRNTGIIQAQGGTIALTAAAGATMVRGVVQVSGELDAPSIGTKNGTIIIAASGSNAVVGNIAADKNKKSGSSVVAIDGVLNASGRKAGEHGGTVTVTGDRIALLNGTRIDASGDSGLSSTTSGKLLSEARTGAAGGDIKIGGDYLGGGSTATASDLYVDPGALVMNDALTRGDAGRSIFWSDNTTQFYGNVYARALGGKQVDTLTWNATGGGNAGDGGFVETSGHGHLDAGGYVDLTSSAGARGTYFLDPTDITIYGNVDPLFQSTDGSINLATNLKLWLDASDSSNVQLTYTDLGLTATGTSGNNTVFVSSTAGIFVGGRIRLGAAGSDGPAAALGPDTYIINAVDSMTNIVTLTSNLTSTYTGAILNRAYISQINDKSGQNNHASNVDINLMPLWIGNVINGLPIARSVNSALLLPINVNPAGSGSYSYGLVWQRPASENSALLLDTNSFGGYYSYLQYGNNWYVSNSTRASVAMPNNTPVIKSAVIDPSTSAAWYSNGALSASASGTDGQQGFNCLGGCGYTLNADIGEVYDYVSTLSSNAQALLNQYQSAKWNIGLTPPGTGATEVTKATAANGYSIFTTRYLEHLAQSADISLQATHDINLDLKGDTLNFAAAGRSLTLNAGNQITTASTGAITTNNGAISLTGTNGVRLTHAVTLNSGTATTTVNGVSVAPVSEPTFTPSEYIAATQSSIDTGMSFWNSAVRPPSRKNKQDSDGSMIEISPALSSWLTQGI